MNIAIADRVIPGSRIGTYSPPGGSMEGLGDLENVTVYKPFLFGVIPITSGRIDHLITLDSRPLIDHYVELEENGLAGLNFLRFRNSELKKQNRNTTECIKISAIGHEMCHLRQELRDGTPSLITDISRLRINDLNKELFQLRFYAEVEAYITSMLSINGSKYSPMTDLMQIPAKGLYDVKTEGLTREDALNPSFFLTMVLSGIPLVEVKALIEELQSNHEEAVNRFLVTREIALHNLDQIPENPQKFFNNHRSHYLSSRKDAVMELQGLSTKCISRIKELVDTKKIEQDSLISYRNGHSI